MSGFVRRFTSFPSADVLSAIEGINIIDLPAPTAPTGTATNVVALIGEFADMSYAVAVDASGNITTSPLPVEIFSAQDLLNKVGGFDSTIGQFGAAMGNGYVELRNKKFGRLVLVPVNLCSASGIRMWRLLPTNKSATDPTPVVPVAAAVVPAGYVLKDNAHALELMKVGRAVQFTGLVAYQTGVDGNVATGVAAATQVFNSPGGGFTTVVRPDGKIGAQIGDILVTGVIGGGTPQGDDSGQHRIVSITDDSHIVVQTMDGSNFSWTSTTAALVWRLHPASTADSYGDGSGSLLTAQGSFTVPVRPLTNDAGTGISNADGTWAVGTSLVPQVAPPALTASSADPLSGLAGKVGPTTAVAYTHLVQAANAANAAAIDALYTTAINSLLNDGPPTSEVSHAWAARKSSTIRSTLLTFADTKSARGTGTTVAISPELNQAQSTVITTVTGNADPGVGANRDERTFYSWPPVTTLIPEAVNFVIPTADGNTTTTGILDTTGDGWLSSIMGVLPPERNPGESSDITRGALKPVLGYARAVPPLDINVWTLLRQRGIAGLRMDVNTGPEIQSGVTTSLLNGQKNINRRKIADYIEDSVAAIAKPYAKSLGTPGNFDNVVTLVYDFLELMLSPDNPAAQRINGFLVDPIGGNTPDLNARGIFVIIVKVRTAASMDFITIPCEIGEGVVVNGTVPVSG